jgi:hypothetical protein
MEKIPQKIFLKKKHSVYKGSFQLTSPIQHGGSLDTTCHCACLEEEEVAVVIHLV